MPNDIRIGLIARCDDSGLGNQTFEFYRHMKPSRVMVIDFKDYNPLPQRTERYPDAWRVVTGFPQTKDLNDFLQDIDIVFTCETPYNYALFEIARQRGIKTALQYNFEYLDYLNRPRLPKPDLLLAPSEWNIERVRDMGLNPLFLPVPVATDRIEPKKVQRIDRFLHIAGQPGSINRNGTDIILEAWSMVDSENRHLTICAQGDVDIDKWELNNVKVVKNVENYWDMYKDHDALLLPRRWGGLSLQIQEAAAAGMLIITSDKDPYCNRAMGVANGVLSQPGEPMVMRGVKVETSEVPPEDLALFINNLHAEAFQTQEVFQRASKFVRQWAETYSWERMAPIYREVFAKCISR